MASSPSQSPLRLFFFSLLASTTLIPLASALKRIESKSLNPCQANTKFSASLFDVIFTPDNNTLTFDIDGVSDIEGNVTAMIEVFAYGFKAFEENIDACELGDDVEGLCPMQKGQITIHSNVELGDDVIEQVPGTCTSKSALMILQLCLLFLQRYRLYGTRSRRSCACLH